MWILILAFDGVYALQAERVKGGGSLSLTDHFSKWLNLENNEFSGSWDLGHLLQLVYGDGFKKNSHVSKFLTKAFKVMSDWKTGKAGVMFRELADDLEHAVLTNKADQKTRWVRSVVRCLQALLRNLPTIGKKKSYFCDSRF